MDKAMQRKLKKKKKSKDPSSNPTDLDMQIMKFLRFKVPRKSTVIQKQSVEYFVGCKAIDVLMESKWASRKNTDYLFVTRDDATRYMDEMLRKNFFYRAMRNKADVKPAADTKNSDTETQKMPEQTDATADTPESTVRRRKIDKAADASDEKSTTTTKAKKKSENKEKKPKEKVKKRYKLTVHEEQVFMDTKDLYVWLYNPISTKTMLMGAGVLFCVIAATLFPLWPPQVRLGVYYLSLAGGSFIGSIFVVALARSILYGVLWALTGGRHNLWILPNILADVGFFESFKPWYTYEYHGKSSEDESEKLEKQSENETEKADKSPENEDQEPEQAEEEDEQEVDEGQTREVDEGQTRDSISSSEGTS